MDTAPTPIGDRETCLHGHAWTRANLRWSGGGWRCKICQLESNRRNKAQTTVSAPLVPWDEIPERFPSVKMDADDWLRFFDTTRGEEAFQRIIGDLVRLGWDAERRSGPKPRPSHDEQVRRLRLIFWQLNFDEFPENHPDALSAPVAA